MMATRKIPSADSGSLPLGRLTRPPKEQPASQPLHRPQLPLKKIPSAASEWIRGSRRR
jgi:hypothetical protein